MFSLSLNSIQSHNKLDTLLAKKDLTIFNSKFGPVLNLRDEGVTKQNQAFINKETALPSRHYPNPLFARFHYRKYIFCNSECLRQPLYNFRKSLSLETVMKEFNKKCFNLTIYCQVTTTPVQELSLASCSVQAVADGLWSCLSPVQSISSPPLATSSSHSS